MADRTAELEKKFDDLINKLDEANQPVVGARMSRDRMSGAFWEGPDSEAKAMKGLMARERFMAGLPKGYKPNKVFGSFGDFLRQGVRAHHPDFGGNTASAAKFGDLHGSIFKAVQGMNTQSGGEGGFLVLPEHAPGIIDRVWDNDLFQRTDNYTVRGNRMTFPRIDEHSRADGSRAGGVQAYWIGEGKNIGSSNPQLAETELKLKKLAVVVYLTEELISDNEYALEQWVMRKVREEFNFMLGAAITRGGGGAQPVGYLNSPARVVVAKKGGQSADTIVAENILSMWSRRMATGSTEDLIWTINQNCEPQLNQMSLGVSTAGGQVVYTPPTGLAGSPYATLMGRPVLPTEFNSTLGNEGDISLVNLSNYCTISKGGISEAVSTHVEFLTDQLALKFVMRVDGRPYDDAPIVPYQSAGGGVDSQSPFVVLAVR